MNLSGFVVRNALRNKRRLALSVSSVAASLFLLITLQVALRELTNPINDEGSSLRIIVRNKVSLAQPLPARQLQVIEKIPGVVTVSPFSFYGGLYKGDEKFTSFAEFAVDPQRTLPLLADAKIPKEQLDAWIADQTSCIVGQMTADRYGLKFSLGEGGVQVHGIVTHIIDKSGNLRARFHGLKFNDTTSFVSLQVPDHVPDR